MPTHPRYRCKFCQAELPAWIPVFNEPNGAMLLHHLGQDHPGEVKAYLDQMHTDEDHDRVVVQAFEEVDE
jgi:hypothetical protein